MTDPVVSHYNMIAEHYEEDYAEPYWDLYFDITWHNIKKFLPRPGSTILDAGGGTGFWARKLATRGHKVVCTDIAENMLSVGKKKAKDLNIKFQNADVCDLSDFKDNSFDFIIAQGDVLSYCSDPEKAVAELRRVARPDTFIIFSVDNLFNALTEVIVREGLEHLDPLMKTGTINTGIHPQHNFTVQEINELLKAHNLQLVSMIAKPALINSVPIRDINFFLEDPANFKKILDLELQFNESPELLGSAGHLEVVAKKV